MDRSNTAIHTIAKNKMGGENEGKIDFDDRKDRLRKHAAPTAALRLSGGCVCLRKKKHSN
jgi:hypothetical protein